MHLTVEDLARFYFQDRLSKFCPTEHDRPNTFEKEMFRYGVEHVKKELESVQKENEELKEAQKQWELAWLNESDANAAGYNQAVDEINALKAENARIREALERIDNECSRDDTIAWKIANDALEELK